MELYPVTSDEQSEIYKRYGTNEQKIEQDVRVLEEWTSKQAHFPRRFQYEEFLKQIMIKNKFSVERTKARLEKYFTLKTMNKDFYEIFSWNSVIPSRHLGQLIPLPKLGPDQSRIFVGQFECETPDHKFIMDYAMQYLLQLVEINFKYDQALKVTFVIDFENLNVGLLTKVDWLKFARFCKLILQGYSSSVNGIHFLNIKSSPSLTVLGILKRLLKEKLAKRIHIHPDLGSLHRSLPKKYLPDEFGGDQPSYRKILYKLDDAVLEHKTFLEESVQYASDESLRIVECPFNDLNGIDGSFRSLNID